MGVISREIPPLYLDAIRRFRLIDDTFFSLCFDGFNEGIQLLLRIFFDRSDLIVKHVVTQRTVGNLYGRGVRFDVLAEDCDGKLYDCEVQRADEGAAPRRARYNSSMLDARELPKGSTYKDLPETWVIFIISAVQLKKQARRLTMAHISYTSTVHAVMLLHLVV